MAKQYGIAVDIDRCTGCGVCVITCKLEHDLPPNKEDKPGTKGVAWNQVLRILEGKYPDLSADYLYFQCMHCENPPCLGACPVGAISKRKDGVVLINQGICNGCKDYAEGPKCMPACPYGAIQFNDRKGIAQACTLCAHRIDGGLEPICVKNCLGNALTFGDLNNPKSEISQKLKEAGDRVFVFKSESGCNPSIRYIKPEKASIEKVSNLNKAKLLYGYTKQPQP